MGVATVTYDAPLKKYLMCVTDGWPTCAKMRTYILEADALTGPWRLVTYMKDFGEQAYFVEFPLEVHQCGRPNALAVLFGEFRLRLERSGAAEGQSARLELRAESARDSAACRRRTRSRRTNRIRS